MEQNERFSRRQWLEVKTIAHSSTAALTTYLDTGATHSGPLFYSEIRSPSFYRETFFLCSFGQTTVEANKWRFRGRCLAQTRAAASCSASAARRGCWRSSFSAMIRKASVGWTSIHLGSAL